MKRSIILIGSESYLGSHFKERLREEHSLILGVKGTGDSSDQTPKVSWSPGSALSAKKLVLEADRILDPLEEVWLVYSPWMGNDHPQEMSITAIEEAVNEHLRAYLFLIREIIMMAEEKGLTLRAFFGGPPQNSLAPLFNAVYEGLAGFIETLVKHRSIKKLRVFGYESLSDKVEKFADYVIKNLDHHQTGSWITFPEPLLPWQKRRRKRSIL